MGRIQGSQKARRHVRIFWCGSARVTDGKVEEVHSFWDAMWEDFHTDFYFSEDQVSKIRRGESIFFWIADDGHVEADWDGSLRECVLSRIKEQITVVKVRRPAEKGRRPEKGYGFLFPRSGDYGRRPRRRIRWKKGQW